MRLLHLSDLHLGKRVHEVSMIEEQTALLEQALEMAKAADITLIAGDIYDRPVPPEEAVRLLDSFLSRMSAQGSPVALISGNHDSAERVAFGASMLGRSGVHIAPVFGERPMRLTLHDEHGAVYIHLLPFVRPVHVRRALGIEEGLDYTQAIRAAVGAMDIDDSARNVLVAHQFVTGSLRSGSEEVIVGGLDNVDADVFEPFDYVALGHLHAAQSLCGGRVRYSGAPLCMDFSEAGQEKCALMVTLGEKGALEVERLPFAPLHPMRRARGSFAQMIEASGGPDAEDYLQITLTDENDIPDALGQLRAVYPNLMQVRNARADRPQAQIVGAQDAQRDPLVLFEEFYSLRNGEDITREQRELVAAMMQRIWEEDA